MTFKTTTACLGGTTFQTIHGDMIYRAKGVIRVKLTHNIKPRESDNWVEIEMTPIPFDLDFIDVESWSSTNPESAESAESAADAHKFLWDEARLHDAHQKGFSAFIDEFIRQSGLDLQSNIHVRPGVCRAYVESICLVFDTRRNRPDKDLDMFLQKSGRTKRNH